jgi:outer membrane protein
MRHNATLNPKGASGAPRWMRRYRRFRRLACWPVLLGVLYSASAAQESPVSGTTAKGESAPATSDEGAAGPVITLDEAYRLAVANEEQIKIAERELAKAQLLTWRAYAQLTPRAEIDGVYTRNKEEIAFFSQPTIPGGSTTPSTIRPGESWQGTFVATQPIIQPSFPPSLQLGKASVRQNAETYGFTIREVLFGVALAYFDVLRSQAQVVVARETLRLTQDQLKQAQARFRVGEVTKTDVLRAEVEVARAERAVITNENTLQLTFTVLARAIGVKEPLRVVEPAPAQYRGGGYEQLVEQSYKQRQDVRAQTAAVEVARQRKNQVVARYFPQVNVQWQFPRLDSPTFANRDRFWTMFLNFQIPLFDGGVREIDLQEQTQNLVETELQLDRLRKDVAVEVKRALLAIETLGETLETLKKEVALAQENYTITSKQYGVGLATSLDVNTSLNNLNQVRTQLTDQTYAYQVALLGLDRAVGVFGQDYLPHR